jgi:protease I
LREEDRKKLRFVVDDFEPGYDTYTEKPGYSWDADVAFPDVNADDYVALVIPRGRAPEYVATTKTFSESFGIFFQEEKPVAHLCHAALALSAAGVLNGRPKAAYPALECDVTGAGARFVNSEAVVDGAMVSARAWPDHPAWMREFMQLLKKKAPAQHCATAAIF